MFKKKKIEDTPICPYLNKPCISNECMMWVTVRGTNSNTGREVDEEGCSISWLPLLMIDNTHKSRELGAAIESFRNDMVAINQHTAAAFQGILELSKKERLTNRSPSNGD